MIWVSIEQRGKAAVQSQALITNSAIRVVGDGGCSVLRTCKRALGGVSMQTTTTRDNVKVWGIAKGIEL